MRYAPDFRAGAVALVRAGRLLIDVAADLGLSSSWLENRVRHRGEVPARNASESVEVRQESPHGRS